MNKKVPSSFALTWSGLKREYVTQTRYLLVHASRVYVGWVQHTTVVHATLHTPGVCTAGPCRQLLRFQNYSTSVTYVVFECWLTELQAMSNTENVFISSWPLGKIMSSLNFHTQPSIRKSAPILIFMQMFWLLIFSVLWFCLKDRKASEDQGIAYYC